MAKNSVAANLLMLVVVAAGLISASGLVQEVFPEFSIDQIRVEVSYPGATPEEVEESIVRKLEQQLEAVDDISEISSISSEGHGAVVAELRLGADAARALNDVKAEVDRIRTFPAGAERPAVSELTTRKSVMRLALFGDVPERTLKELARRTEDELVALPAISLVETSGVRAYEISIEVSLHQLRALGLALADVTDAVRRGSMDLSAGSIDARGEQVRIRTIGQNYSQKDFEDIVVLGHADGATIRLGDIAEVHDGFRDVDLVTSYRGKPAAFVDVYRTSNEQVLDVAEAVERHANEVVKPSLPAGVQLDVWSNDAEVFQDRLELLRKNAFIGLALVLAALALFLEARLAMWVAVGIGVSFVGAFAMMLALGISINMLSMFAFILAVGVVVDDAIVVGESIYRERERGFVGTTAAIRGVTRVKGIAIFAVLTSVVAFSPLLTMGGVAGKFAKAIPVIVISVLLISLLESLLVLPNHLAHLPAGDASPRFLPGRLLARARKAVTAALTRFTEGPLDRALRLATGRPPVVLATGVATMILCAALVRVGIVKMEYFPSTEADVVRASLEMPAGTAGDRTAEVARALESAGHRTAERLSALRPADAPPLVDAVNLTVGERARMNDPFSRGPSGDPKRHVATVEFKLLKAENRSIPAAVFRDAWRAEAGPVHAARSVAFSSELITLAPSVQVEVSHSDPRMLAEANDTLVRVLRSMPGVFDVRTNYERGFSELQVEPRDEGLSLGIPLERLARQVRSAFFGDEALRVQRGREDVPVYVRLPEEERNAVADVERFLVRTSQGAEVPLDRVASVRVASSPTTIHRKNSRRVVTVQAEVDPATTASQDVTNQLAESLLPRIAERHPGLAYSLGGEQKERAESMRSLGRGFLLAILVIYALLAIPFGSYTKPLIVMAAIPFGIVGAVLGHLALGLKISVMSVAGIVGLSGVVVNDSLVMIDFIEKRLQQGMPVREAVVDGAKARFRPIFLTSLTTFLGMAPLVFERSLQAQFLVPIAASLGFGIVFATVVLMMIVPALATMHAQAAAWRAGRAAT